MISSAKESLVLIQKWPKWNVRSTRVIEQALKEIWNEAILKSSQAIEDGSEAGEFYANKIRKLKEK